MEMVTITIESDLREPHTPFRIMDCGKLYTFSSAVKAYRFAQSLVKDYIDETTDAQIKIKRV